MPDKPFLLGLMVTSKAGAYLRVEQLEGARLCPQTLIRLGCTGLPGPKTLVYYEQSLITSVKSFIKLALDGLSL